jgi:hypothetical protein
MIFSLFLTEVTSEGIAKPFNFQGFPATICAPMTESALFGFDLGGWLLIIPDNRHKTWVMEFRFLCPSCGRKLKADEEAAGMKIDCRPEIR